MAWQQLEHYERNLAFNFPALDFRMFLRNTGNEEFHRDLKALIYVLKNQTYQILYPAMVHVQRRVVYRAYKSFPAGPYMTEYSGPQGPSMAMDDAWRKVLGIMRQPIQPGQTGFFPRAEMDAVRLQELRGSRGLSRIGLTQQNERGQVEEVDLNAIRAGGAIKAQKTQYTLTTNSEYDVAWMIAEFGTGIYALPHRRTEGDAKVPGGSGAWYLNKVRKYPVILGQPGGHFLFGTRGADAEMRADAAVGEKHIIRAVQNLMAKRLTTEGM